ncbi:hypothetical protein GYMLUDRAFT_521455 [Collybiopsis luxurians FD-317 M1]|nr:hypothetical protein GYMLUDRAFT_521455 [Collybiopsis luxurians FD-317 M1]
MFPSNLLLRLRLRLPSEATSTMRFSPVRSMRILSRNAVPPKTRIIPSLPAILKASAETAQPTVIDILTKRKTAAAENWPANLRIEPIVQKKDLKNVHASIRPQLKELMKEV